MPNAITDKVSPAALITGGGRRIGSAIALTLARAGYAVVLHAHRSRQEVELLATEILDNGGRATVILGDLADHHVTGRLMPEIATFGPLTLLVNNASEFNNDEIETLERRQFDRTLAVNLTAPLFLIQAFAAQAPAAANASIINILDQRVLKPTPRFLSYSLSKSALYAATTILAQALAPKLRVNAVAPGPTLPGTRQSENEFAAQIATLPLARGPIPEDIASAVLFLAEAKCVTGITIAVDGGQHVAWRTPDSDFVE
jgi:NAD(P)-dependent dehydrogenase (short-subunit alcohol dehydrogenase family)